MLWKEIAIQLVCRLDSKSSYVEVFYCSEAPSGCLKLMPDCVPGFDKWMKVYLIICLFLYFKSILKKLIFYFKFILTLLCYHSQSPNNNGTVKIVMLMPAIET